MRVGEPTTAWELQQALGSLLAMRLSVRVTDNLHTMLSFGRRAEGLTVRLHRMFLHAPPRVVEALARYIASGDAEASTALDRFIDRHRWMIRRPPADQRRRRFRLRTRGVHHDLAVTFRALERLYFEHPVDCAITWGTAPRTRLPRRSIKLGSYAPESRLIRIHPALDQAHVPPWFVGWIVYHEMLHHQHGIQQAGGRRRIHPPAFLEDERRYVHFERARRWERENIHGLLAWSPDAGTQGRMMRGEEASSSVGPSPAAPAASGAGPGASMPGRGPSTLRT